MVEFRVNPILKEHTDKVKLRIHRRDKDWVAVIDGEEGSGKSVFGQQLAKILDPTFNIDKLVFTYKDFEKAITSPDRKKGDCILFDEAYHAMNTRGAMTSINRAMISIGTEMRQANLFVIIILPSFFDLEKYFAIWRSRVLFHVYEGRRGRMGMCKIWTKKKKLKLYIKGKKTYNYACVKPSLPPIDFTNTYTVDETEYRIKKREAFINKEVSQIEANYRVHLGKLVMMLKNEFKVTYARMGEELGVTEALIRQFRNFAQKS